MEPVIQTAHGAATVQNMLNLVRDMPMLYGPAGGVGNTLRGLEGHANLCQAASRLRQNNREGRIQKAYGQLWIALTNMAAEVPAASLAGILMPAAPAGAPPIVGPAPPFGVPAPPPGDAAAAPVPPPGDAAAAAPAPPLGDAAAAPPPGAPAPDAAEIIAAGPGAGQLVVHRVDAVAPPVARFAVRQMRDAATNGWNAAWTWIAWVAVPVLRSLPFLLLLSFAFILCLLSAQPALLISLAARILRLGPQLVIAYGKQALNQIEHEIAQTTKAALTNAEAEMKGVIHDVVSSVAPTLMLSPPGFTEHMITYNDSNGSSMNTSVWVAHSSREPASPNSPWMTGILFTTAALCYRQYHVDGGGGAPR